MEMGKIYNIKYVDAYYLYSKEVDNTKLSLHEAFGYVKKNGNNIIITFIKKRDSDEEKDTILGLAIPDTALISKENIVNKNIFVDFKIGMSVSVKWRDPVIFDKSNLRNDCPIMYTEGILFKIEKDYFVLKNPETIRIYPTPIKNHPVKKPNYYIIPTSLIVDMTILKINK